MLSEAGRKGCPLFVLFHNRVCGPLCGSLFVHRPSAKHRPPESQLEAANHKADQAIEEIIELLAA